MKNANISAISTPAGKGGVAVIRISGDSPLTIAQKMFKPMGKTVVENFEPYRMYPGEIDAGDFKDFGLCVYFKAPKSFTGEDIVEFHCHGGVNIARGILRRTFELGAKSASRGEFTKRAFLKGKLSLSSAEGLIDMINGESDAEVRAGYMLYSERLKKTADEIQAQITEILAGIDADIDFPEEDLEHTDLKDIKISISQIKDKLSSLCQTYSVGKKIRQGVNVVIAGRPNTGKSSILNALIGSDKAIVSSVAGTTRDVVEGCFEINGVRFNMYDTAGIHESENEIENIGIERARTLLDGADIILFVIDGTVNLTQEDYEIYKKVKEKTHIVVYNKSDISSVSCDIADIKVSAKTGENIQTLKDMIAEKSLDGYDADAEYLIEQRHYFALCSARDCLNEALLACGNAPLDLLSIDLKRAWDYLGEISGVTASEKIIDEIFAKFCVGK